MWGEGLSSNRGICDIYSLSSQEMTFIYHIIKWKKYRINLIKLKEECETCDFLVNWWICGRFFFFIRKRHIFNYIFLDYNIFLLSKNLCPMPKSSFNRFCTYKYRIAHTLNKSIIPATQNLILLNICKII